MLRITDVNTQQRGFVRGLDAVGGSGSPEQIAEHLQITAEEVIRFFEDLPPGWAEQRPDGSLALTSEGQSAVETVR